ncbi:MAG: ROK family protein, partial [Deefgea sp.]
MNLLAFDIGGTQIKYGIVSNTGEVLSATVVDTPKYEGGEAVIELLRELTRTMMNQYVIAGIAISTFGLVDAYSGLILGAAEAVEGYAGVSPKAALEKEFG